MKKKTTLLMLFMLFFLIGSTLVASCQAEPSIDGSEINIIKPKRGYLYVNDHEIMPLGLTVIIGAITIEVETSDDIDGIDIFIDDELRFHDPLAPYARYYNERCFGRKTIGASDAETVTTDELSAYIFNMPTQKPQIVINELMSAPAEDQSEWIELYNAGEDTNINDFIISSSQSGEEIPLPDWEFPTDTYLLVDFGSGIHDEDFSDGNATYYVDRSTDMLDDDMDEIALYSGSPDTDTILDFISYSDTESYDPGLAHTHATQAGIWDEGDCYYPMDNRTSESRYMTLTQGDSIGRDYYSNDTDTSQDWDILGGADAFHPTPRQPNFDVFGIIGETLPESTKLEEKEWTVMVYMADCNLESDFWRQLDELENVGTDDNINIVFQIDGYNDLGPNTREVYQDGTGAWLSRNQHKAFRGFILKDNNDDYIDWETERGSLKYNDHRFIHAYNKQGDPLCVGEINTGDNIPLKEFIDWAKLRAPANNYALILGGHGAGWKGLMVDESDGNDYLTMDELETALRGTPRFSVIGFDLCMMANIEVAYQIRDWSQYMVASEEIDVGWDYEDIFGYLQQHPDIYGDTLCIKMVDSYHQQQSSWGCHTLSAINLGRLSSLYGKVRLLANHLIEGMEDWGDTEDESFKTHFQPSDNCQMDVKDSLYASEHYAYRNYIDLYHFVYLLGHNSGIYEDYKEPWEDILDAINGPGGVVIHNEHGNKHPNSYGLSIYFPRNLVDTVNFNDCEGNNGVDYPFDFPWPSRVKTPADSYAIYAIDDTTQWGKVPYVGGVPHPYPETPNFLWRDENIHWDEFLHRYYKPCADAGEDVTVEVDCGETARITLDGTGSSSTDDDGIVHEYHWDLDLQQNSDNGDWEKDGVDEYNDDSDASGPTIQHDFAPGVYVVTLTVWDDHHLKNRAICQDFPNEHWQTDQDSVVITVIERPCEDEETPDITIYQPEDGVEVFENIIEFIGWATDNIGIIEFGYYHEWIDGHYTESWDVDGLDAYEFVFDLFLYEGANNITVYASDAAGNTGSENLTIYYTTEDDVTSPVTIEIVGEPNWEGGYLVSPATPLWLNATDDLSGVYHIAYEIWWDSDEDGVADLQLADDTVTGDTFGFSFLDFDIYYGLAELRYYAVDNAGNTEPVNIATHFIQE